VAHPAEVRIIGLPGMPEVQPGDDVGALVLHCCQETNVALEPGDIVVITHKVISKSEGRLVDLRAVEPSPFASQFGQRHGKDPRHVEVVLRESARVVRMDRGLIIAETHHGLICANAGVDASNIAGEETVCLLPLDPDASADRARATLEAATGFHLPVIITDSFGRPWRDGIINIAIGVSGLRPLADYRGQEDDHGRTMQASLLAIGDEIAAASELVMGKVSRAPVAIVRGYPYTAGTGSARELQMPPQRDMFR
jgi:coenzyme F420-0:L-glutamate ligase / coenzyme F420-1:gamma-L-glutamate ligase